jgi:hypothetical protein
MIFLSYARQNEGEALKIFNYLMSRGYDVWFDKTSLKPGQKWKPTIKVAIENASVFLALLSSESVSKRGFVQSELKTALEVLDTFPEEKIYMIPLRLDDCEVRDTRLAELHYVDLFPDFETGMAKVLTTIATSTSEKPTQAIGESRMARRPRIIEVAVKPSEIIGGGEARFRVRAESNAPVVWLNRTLKGSRGNIYGGGSSCVFVEVSPNIWEISWLEYISPWAPSGTYELNGVSVRNEGEAISEEAEPIRFEVRNSKISDDPVIESVTLSSHRIPTGSPLSVTVRARSQAPVDWLNRSLDGPKGNRYGGGMGVRFTQHDPQIWVFTWNERFSEWSPKGRYTFSGIAVRNEAQEWSEEWPEIHFEVV